MKRRHAAALAVEGSTMDHEAILKMAGLVELPERKLRVNPDLRKAFSDEAIRAHDSQWLNEHLAEQVPAAEFWLYFNSVPDNANQTCREVLVPSPFAHA